MAFDARELACPKACCSNTIGTGVIWANGHSFVRSITLDICTANSW
jgi:hypothetical protein